jgi:predicted lipoprotein with Yx(FWY)xxD motif
MGKGIQRRVFTGLALASSLSIGIAACGNAGGGGLTIGEGGGANVGQGDAGSESAAAAPNGGKGGSSGKGGSGGTGGSAQGGGDAEGGDSPGGAGVPAGDAGNDGVAAAGGSPTNEGGTGNDTGDDHGGHAGEDDGGGSGGTGGDGDGAGGVPDSGIGGDGGGADAGGAPGVEPRCVFHTDAPVDTGEGGAGGAAAELPAITVEVSPFIGPYLADSTGRTLYGYGADYVGDCETPPVSNCLNDCLLSWPVFDAPVRTLGAGLDETAFGQITRSDGLTQTTYYGWPLYYYKTDTAKGMINGQGKGKIWFAAETVLPNVNIMRASAANGGVKYLGDDRGRTLYTFAGDTPGNGQNPPVIGCTGSCLLAFRPFEQTQLLPVSYLEPADLRLFVGPGGRSQVAYRGQPLYTAVADTASGQLNGLAETNGALSVP